MKYSSRVLVIFITSISSIKLISNFSVTDAIDTKSRNNNLKIICTNFSKNRESQKSCFETVKQQNWLKNESDIHPKLLCVLENFATITWTNDTTYEELAIQISSTANQSIAIYSRLGSQEKYLDFSDLKSGTEYQVLILRRNFRSEEISQNSVSKLNFTTVLEEENATSSNNTWFEVAKISPVDGTYINATIKLNSLNGVLPCWYTVNWFSKKDRLQDTQCSISRPEECIIPNLRYNSTYEIWMDIFSEQITILYSTPSCHEFAQSENLTCPIPQVEGISAINNDFTDDSNCSVTISWKSIAFQPEYYQVTIEIRTSNESRSFYAAKNVTNGNSLIVSLPYDVIYLVIITAHKNNLSSDPSFEEFFTPYPSRRSFSKKIQLDTGENGLNYGNVFSVVAVILLAILICLYFKYKQSDDTDFKKKKKYDGILIKNMETIPSTIEIKKKSKEPQKLRLVLGKMLGKGNFGIVFRGTLTTNGKKVMDVAVKTLRDNATANDIQQFEKEINLMEDVGFHNNIVSMIGSCLNAKRPLLIVEYCPLGDLHGYLCDIKKTQVNFPDYNPAIGNQYQNLVPIENGESSKYLVHNKIYGITKDVVVPELSICDLLSYGRQVAIGMEYLASNYVIHRDLAARNILLCNDKTVKISDFGLSRDIYAENIYRKLEGCEIMPIKWMALESICNREYSTLSDVWSFGVFLWELFTMGDEPYPDITVPEVLVLQLREGHRMHNPCPSYPELYEVMLNCWQEQPELRPQFSVLHDSLDQILKQCSPNQYITITANEGSVVIGQIKDIRTIH